MKVKGVAHKYGDNINTDIISPPESMELQIKDACKLAMKNVDPDFVSRVKAGDIFVAEENLGSGSSRETSPLCLRELGIKCIVAKSFARIFYRNCINVGLLAIECSDTDKIQMGDIIEVDYGNGVIINNTSDAVYNCSKIPEHILSLVEKGGLIPFLETKING
jgi:3-isopropylmalate/(R)-2-methylmalate dehydratase small subunit